ncbi:MAG: hypothetical protein WC528_02890 [Patescibacteria group bacterium]
MRHFALLCLGLFATVMAMIAMHYVMAMPFSWVLCVVVFLCFAGGVFLLIIEREMIALALFFLIFVAAGAFNKLLEGLVAAVRKYRPLRHRRHWFYFGLFLIIVAGVLILIARQYPPAPALLFFGPVCLLIMFGVECVAKSSKQF